tara:strand:- start:7484 stop:8062 length:579 start_codon:yes stop_codon:yes gene_type:complete
MKFKGKEYTEVKDRLAGFLSDYPGSTIQTELVSVSSITDTPSGEQCNEYVVKATVVPNPLQEPEIYYTGYAAERDNTGFVNKTSALENCETSAVGRALAFAGFGGDFAIASKEEVENAKAAQKKSAVTVDMLDKLDTLSRKVKPYIGEEHFKTYRDRRSAGFYDTKVRYNKTMDFFTKSIPAPVEEVADGSK